MKYPEVTKEPDGKPNLTVYIRLYNSKKRFKDMSPIDLLPNDKLEVIYSNLKPSTIYARAILNDTKTIRDLTPTSLGCGNQYTISYDRNINNVNCENRIGITHQIRLV